MSRDTKASCTDCQGHAEAPAVPFVSPFSVSAIRDELNEPERSVRPVSSFVATTCPSDTDEADYETSSEGMALSKRSGTRVHGAQTKESLCVYLKKKSAPLSKRAAFNRNVPAIKREIISDPPHELMENRLTQKTTYVCDRLILTSENLAQSKSLPILRSDVPTDFTAADAVLMPASTSMCKRKMTMIVKRTAPLVSPYLSVVSLTTGATTNFFRDRRYETRRLASTAMLPIFSDTAVINDGRSKAPVAEVTLHETKNNRRAMNWDPRRDAIPTFVNDEGAARVTNNDDDDDDDLVDVARNPYSSIKSVYFPPNLSDPLVSPCDYGNPRKPQRVSTDVETLLKIDHELGPLRYQYSEIIGKARALGLGNASFDLDISRRPRQPDAFVWSAPSPSTSDYFPDLRQAAIGTGIANRSALVDKTPPPSTFSVVGKLTPRGSRTSWLNENDGSSRRQEAVNCAARDPSRVLACLDGPRPSGRVRNSVSYFPTTNSHIFRRENVPHDRSRNGCVSNSNFQPYRKSEAVIERTTSTWDGWLARETIDTNPTNIFNRTEYNSHRYLNRTVKDSRISTGNTSEIRRRESSVSIVKVIDSDWPAVNERTAYERSNEHSGIIPPGDQSSPVVETKFTGRDGNYHESTSGTVVKDGRLPSFLALKSIEPGDRGVLQASARAPQIRVFSMNAEFRTTVEKRYTSRAVSPIQHSRVTTVSSATTSPTNVLLAAKVSSIFVQQVHADSSGEEIEGSSPAKIRSVDVDKRDALANAASKRDFCVQKVESRAENPSRSPEEFRRDEADLTTTESGKPPRYLRLPRAKEKITIVPIVLAHGGISEPARAADVDFAIRRYPVKAAPRLSYRIESIDARKFYGTSSSPSRDNAGYRRDVADSTVCSAEELASEKRRRSGGTSVSRVNRRLPADEDYPPSATASTVGNPRRPIRITSGVVRKAREYRESGGQRVAKTIPGMRSTPEDFLCET